MVTQTRLNVYGLSSLNITAGGRLYGPLRFQEWVNNWNLLSPAAYNLKSQKVIKREEVFTTVDVENVVFWDMAPCSLVYYKIKHSGRQQF